MLLNLSRRIELLFWDVATPAMKHSTAFRVLVRSAYQLRAEGVPRRYWGVLALSGIAGFFTGMIASILVVLL